VEIFTVEGSPVKRQKETVFSSPQKIGAARHVSSFCQTAKEIQGIQPLIKSKCLCPGSICNRIHCLLMQSSLNGNVL